MPYIIKEVKKGYKVCKRDEPDTCFSKKPLSKSHGPQFISSEPSLQFNVKSQTFQYLNNKLIYFRFYLFILLNT